MQTLFLTILQKLMKVMKRLLVHLLEFMLTEDLSKTFLLVKQQSMHEEVIELQKC